MMLFFGMLRYDIGGWESSPFFLVLMGGGRQKRHYSLLSINYWNKLLKTFKMNAIFHHDELFFQRNISIISLILSILFFFFCVLPYIHKTSVSFVWKSRENLPQSFYIVILCKTERALGMDWHQQFSIGKNVKTF